jgi:hypothetical protein
MTATSRHRTSCQPSRSAQRHPQGWRQARQDAGRPFRASLGTTRPRIARPGRHRGAAAGMRTVRRGIHAAAARWSAAVVLQSAVPAAGAHGEAEAQGGRERPGPGGAGRPFCKTTDPDDADVILEQIAERIAAEAEAMPRVCPWCISMLSNGAAFCSPVCQEDYHRKLMPRPQRGGERVIIPSFERVAKRRRDPARAAAWRAGHGLDP